MKTNHLTNLVAVTLVAMLIQSTVFADEYIGTAESRAERESRVLDRNDAFLESDAVKGISFKPGQALPHLDIQEGGEFYIGENEIVKRPWSSKCFEEKGKVQVVQYVADNRGATRQNKLFNDTLINRHFSSEQLDTTVIVHMADTMGFVQGFVVKKIAKNKEKYKTINFVVDDHGEGLQRWGMKHKSSAIIVLDAEGKVLFAKDGPLSESEVESTIGLIESQMG